MKPGTTAALCLSCAVLGCNTAGSAWMAQPLDGEPQNLPPLTEAPALERSAPVKSTRTRVIAETPSTLPPTAGAAAPSTNEAHARLGGKSLGTFKNTYYDFPSEADYSGDAIELMNGSCKPIVSVPRTFYESVCVQGSGTLRSGGTVSFAKRDCSCAAECPRTGQHICFDLLDKQQFPWGRGATGKGITPLLSVAVDSSVIPLGTALYIPEYDGVARDATGSSRHDGCFLAEDRGLAVKGQQVDVFTGHREITQLWNRLVPTNSGVTVIVDDPRCRRAR
jgi:3D (Asp-Asp-Asp) domain-containing protein